MQDYNETEVRARVIDPLLRKLGYFSEDDENVFLKFEEKLAYPYFHIGHKSKKKDLPLGFPDYRAGVKGRRGSFIVEAKAATVGLSAKDVEQAHSYAAHAQVGANYFVLCDGLHLKVFETLSGHEAEPLIDMDSSEIEARYHEIENVLSPTSLAKNCQVEYDMNLKLCDGLGSAVKIRAGIYEMDEWDYRFLVGGNDMTALIKPHVPQIGQLERDLETLKNDLELRVSDGVAERDADGQIQARVTFQGATKNNALAMKLLGIETMYFSTGDKFISTDPNAPSIFESTAEFSVEQGTMLPPLFGEAAPADVDAIGDVFVTARMHVTGSEILGEYRVTADYWLDVLGLGKMKIEYDVAGEFSLELDV